MAPKTPWTKGSSSLPSDKLRPKQQQQQLQKKISSNPNTPTTDQIPKSRQVRDLEYLISNLESATNPIRDPKGGCFCLGRVTLIILSNLISHQLARHHPLSTYTPLCKACGLILCSLNKPYHLCPNSNCPSPRLLSTPQELINQLKSNLISQLKKEETEKLRLEEEKRVAAGAFPSLQSTTNPHQQQQQQPEQQQKTSKILSLSKSKTGNKKLITISSSHPSPSSSIPSSRAITPEDQLTLRISEPPKTVIHAIPPPSLPRSTELLSNSTRPWRNYTLGLGFDGNFNGGGGGGNGGDDVKYIPVRASDLETKEETKSRRGRRNIMT